MLTMQAKPCSMIRWTACNDAHKVQCAAAIVLAIARTGAAMPETTHRLATNFMQGKEVRSVHRMVKTRLYFTSESHMYAMLNVLRSVY